MTWTRAPIVVAASGPDGAGKSTLVRRIAPMLRERGFAVTTTYCYGCFLCRRLDRPPHSRSGNVARGRRASTVLGSWVDRVHALVDAAELMVRLTAANIWTLVRARGRPTVVVTDRGPLDGLAKFNPAPGSMIAKLLTGLARRYDVTLFFDHEPGESMTRVAEEAAEPLGDPWAPYRFWVPRLPSVVALNAALTPAAISGEAVRCLTGRAEAPGEKKHVVISTYDNSRNPWYGGGGAAAIEKVALRLSEQFRVTVVTAARHGGTWTDGTVDYRFVPVGRAGPRAGQLLFQASLPFIARTLPHDLWLESFTPPFSTSFLPLFTRRPVVGIDQLRSGEVMWRKYHLPFFLVERLGFRCYPHLVVMNEADAAAVRRLSPKASVQVIENGVERQYVDEDRLGEGNHILFMGRIDTWSKGLDLLVAASAQGSLSIPLLLAGSGAAPEEKKLKALLAGQGRQVRWLGHVSGERKQNLLKNSAFIVLPSRHETFGLAALEGMSYGKPVLHFDLPGLRWMRGSGGVDVPPFDVDLLADRMRRLAADAQWRRRLGREAYRGAQRHTWEEMTGRYLTLVRRLVGSPVPAGSGRPDRHSEGEEDAS
jgi:glycosyltransferase involved in cell wall biosynthesis